MGGCLKIEFFVLVCVVLVFLLFLVEVRLDLESCVLCWGCEFCCWVLSLLLFWCKKLDIGVFFGLMLDEVLGDKGDVLFFDFLYLIWLLDWSFGWNWFGVGVGFCFWFIFGVYLRRSCLIILLLGLGLFVRVGCGLYLVVLKYCG